jgi:hypothetical protein
MNNLIVNGDFQGPKELYTIVTGTPGAGQVNTLVAAPLATGWTVSGDFTTMVATGSSNTFPGILVANIPGVPAAALTPTIYDKYPAGAGAILFLSGLGTGGTLTSGSASALSISQRIVQGARAAQGCRCDFSIWHQASGSGKYRIQIQSIVDTITTTLLDSSVQVNTPGAWRQHRRQFTVPLLPVDTISADILITITVEDGAGGTASIAALVPGAYPTNGLNLAAACLAVTNTAVDTGVFSDTDRFFESKALLSADSATHASTVALTSGTYTASTVYEQETVYLSSASTITAITIALPTVTVPGQIFRIHSKSIVTTLTVTGGAFVDAAVVALTAGQTVAYQAVDAVGTYIRA